MAIRSRRALPSNKIPIFCGIIFSFIALSLLTLWSWSKCQQLVKENGPAILSQRFTDIVGQPVLIKSANLSFPPKLTLFGTSIQNSDQTILHSTDRLELRLAGLHLLLGRLKLKEIKFISPKLHLPRVNFATVEISFQDLFHRLAQPWDKPDPRLTQAITPLAWPIIISPDALLVDQGIIEIKDEQNILPHPLGIFNLNLRLMSENNSLSIKAAAVSMQNIPFFYEGINGDISGQMTYHNDSLVAELSLLLSQGDKAAINIAVAHLGNQPDCSLKINFSSLDIKNLTLIKFPIIDLPIDSTVSGYFSAVNPVLYGTQCDSLTGNLNYTQGRWTITGIIAKLDRNRGRITGSISPITGKKQATLMLDYQGTSLPDIVISPPLKKTIPPDIWHPPVQISSELTVDFSTNPLQANRVKLTGSLGDFFVIGNVELFQGKLALNGTYLTSLSQDTTSKNGVQGATAIPVAITGSIRRPELKHIISNEH